ncbi:MAG: hypothetical protein ACYCOU_25210 [Sulfobacillus sp.]
MSELKVVVPEEMLKTACNDHHAVGINRRDIYRIIEAVLRYQSEHPKVPTDCDLYEMDKRAHDSDWLNNRRFLCVEWQRIKDLAPEPEAPERIQALVAIAENLISTAEWCRCDLDHALLEAYRRGLQDTKK